MDSTKDTVLKMFESIQKGTEFILQAIPEDKLDHKIDESGSSLGKLAFHLAALPLGSVLFANGTFTEFPAVEKLMEKLSEYIGEEMKNNDFAAIFRKSCEVFINYYQTITNDDWVNTTYSTFLSRGPTTPLQGFLSTQNHLIQHRGTLFAYLRTLEIPVTLKQYWGYKPLQS
ncbi:MAG: DinB family protein [Candidatus Kariarchaeaceae archaeon]|jgi:uncharacterized damage-inducible protein DinB